MSSTISNIKKRIYGFTYFTARTHFIANQKKVFNKLKGDPILIYQMGKVGSSSILRSLKNANLTQPLYHAHYLSKSRVRELENRRRKFFRSSSDTSYKRPWLYRFIQNQLRQGDKGRHWKIISLTRDPIARNLSAFFENLTFQFGSDSNTVVVESDYYAIPRFTFNMQETGQLVPLFFDKLDHSSPLTFFDRELMAVSGIDVYAVPFSKDRGYQLYRNNNFDLLLIRLENLSECAGKALNDFMGIDGFTLTNSNVGDKKAYSSLYSTIKNTIVLPDSYIDEMYNSKYMKHFYTHEEIDKLRAKWKGQI